LTQGLDEWDYEDIRVVGVECHERIVELLLEAGADVNAQDGEYGTALHAASFRGREQIVKLLLKAGADVNAQGGNYRSALRAALSEDGEQAVKLLS
jgi:ankyrin repeat protein